MQAHLDTEAYLRESGLKYTVLREGLYAESFPLYLGYFEGRKTKEVFVPSDGGMCVYISVMCDPSWPYLLPSWFAGIAWAVRDELGEATAKVLASDDPSYDNGIFRLSGPKAYTLTQLAALISSVYGSHITVNIVSKEEHIERNKHRGAFIETWATTFDGLQKVG